MFQAGLAKFIFGILGTGGAVTTMPMAYVAVSQTAYKTLWRQTISRGGPVCYGDYDGSTYMVVYDPVGSNIGSKEGNGVLRLLQRYNNNGLYVNEIRKGNGKDMINPRTQDNWWQGYQIGDALADYGFTNVGSVMGERKCGDLTGEKVHAVIDKVSEMKNVKLSLENCRWKVISIECNIAIADENVLNGREEDKPTITYSVF